MALNVFIIGLGLIGGSLGMALKGSPLVGRLTGFDLDSATVKKALELGVVDKVEGMEEGAAHADVIFLCTPMRFYREIIEKISPFLQAGTIITDVGSTKLEVMELFKQMPSGVWGIGGHPMAGAEIRGIDGADRYLFENAIYVLVPQENTPTAVIDDLSRLLAVTGAKITMMEDVQHDQIVAVVSHVPHLTAAALVNLTAGRSENLMLAAGGFRDTTRIASSDPELWEDIIFSNRRPLCDQLEGLIKILKNLQKALAENDHQALKTQLEMAHQTRNRIPRIHKGLIPGLWDVICIVPDSPGIIGELGRLLGEYDININDIEILRVREGDGGTMRLGVSGKKEALKAVEVLRLNKIKAWMR